VTASKSRPRGDGRYRRCNGEPLSLRLPIVAALPHLSEHILHGPQLDLGERETGFNLDRPIQFAHPRHRHYQGTATNLPALLGQFHDDVVHQR
jgi:hypothetical protein